MSNVVKTFPCPFPQCPKQGEPYKHITNLKQHIAVILMRDGDVNHPLDHSLWTTPYVKSLLLIQRRPRTPEERRLARKRRNQRYRERHAEELKQRRDRPFMALALEPNYLANPAKIYDDLIIDFNSLHHDHQNRFRAVAILERLKEKQVPVRYCAKALDSIRSTNTYAPIQMEVVGTYTPRIQFRNVMTGERETSDEKSKDRFLEAFGVFQSEVDHDPHDPRARASVIWDLELFSDGKLSEIIQIPDAYKHGHVFRSYDDGTPAIRLTITPAGTISEPYINQTGSGTLFIQVLGRKVFIVWPPTSKNLEWFANKSGIHYGTIFEAALRHLEFPECIVFEQGQYEILGPGYIHGDLSAMNSAISGVPVVHSSLRSQADLAMTWEKQVMARREAGTTLERATLKGIQRGLQEDETLWRELDMIQEDNV